jgi:hypothetical protein
LVEVGDIAISTWHSRFCTQAVIRLKTRTEFYGWQRSRIQINEARNNVGYNIKINNNPEKDGGRTSSCNKRLAIDIFLDKKG